MGHHIHALHIIRSVMGKEIPPLSSLKFLVTMIKIQQQGHAVSFTAMTSKQLLELQSRALILHLTWNGQSSALHWAPLHAWCSICSQLSCCPTIAGWGPRSSACSSAMHLIPRVTYITMKVIWAFSAALFLRCPTAVLLRHLYSIFALNFTNQHMVSTIMDLCLYQNHGIWSDCR